jgi:hypothetical protein
MSFNESVVLVVILAEPRCNGLTAATQFTEQCLLKWGTPHKGNNSVNKEGQALRNAFHPLHVKMGTHLGGSL